MAIPVLEPSSLGGGDHLYEIKEAPAYLALIGFYTDDTYVLAEFVLVAKKFKT